ncbi:hypothetical protein [Ktedonospora formicarum]|uniref:Uncharacterized protein n=1 Tax=Ktedonospora formicarum TaxID=2778364 RepID=A0A8J3I0P7_9CHLR|nr:hypothetical protein [Ktedonospora formicarum]GHO44528.1 hypothetical protein KSX_26910 [Ktedonospora formicarum]
MTEVIVFDDGTYRVVETPNGYYVKMRVLNNLWISINDGLPFDDEVEAIHAVVSDILGE